MKRLVSNSLTQLQMWHFFSMKKELTFFSLLRQIMLCVLIRSASSICFVENKKKILCEYPFLCSAIVSSEFILFVCVEVLRPSQPNGVMSSAVSLPNHTFTGQA